MSDFARFKGFPPLINTKMLMELIPIQVAVDIFIKCFIGTLIKLTLFEWAMEKITKEIFSIENKRHDDSPPIFKIPCSVKQSEDTDYTNPGVIISYEAKDPDSKVIKVNYFVGTAPAGKDLVPSTGINPELKTTFQPLKLPEAKSAYFTIEACNSDGPCSTTTCKLPSWDLTLTQFDLRQVCLLF